MAQCDFPAGPTDNLVEANIWISRYWERKKRRAGEIIDV